ncbi:hypothetical protein L3V82_04545 [Thiotrichales bacterium 19S3-7]|nr:hypothetical protein [Thiotrichales bacterium 19S3-7]MCF6801365.1 hypothetical protein [Thiotrichales bacterium 19S3-11]
MKQLNSINNQQQAEAFLTELRFRIKNAIADSESQYTNDSYLTDDVKAEKLAMLDKVHHDFISQIDNYLNITDTLVTVKDQSEPEESNIVRFEDSKKVVEEILAQFGFSIQN